MQKIRPKKHFPKALILGSDSASMLSQKHVSLIPPAPKNAEHTSPSETYA